MGDRTKDDVLTFIAAMKPYIQDIVREETKNNLKTAPATVVSADNNAHTAVVKQIFSETEMTLRNCTGKALAEGDSVILIWFGSQTNAWIGIKNDGLAWNT